MVVSNITYDTDNMISRSDLGIPTNNIIGEYSVDYQIGTYTEETTESDKIGIVRAHLNLM